MGIIALLISILLPALNKAREMANRAKCASNLREIGQALALYANDNAGNYPRTGYSPGNANSQAPDLTNTGLNASDPFDTNNPFDGGNNIPSALFLLARVQNMTMGVFVCPSSSSQIMNFNGGGVLNFCNFSSVPATVATTSASNLGYSIENPYAGSYATGDGWRWNNQQITADYAVAADMNPGIGGSQDPTKVNTVSSEKQMQSGNSLNHATIGENVLYGDGHVDFDLQPLVGINRDCIYSIGGTRNSDGQGGCLPQNGALMGTAAVWGSPYSHDDSILLPTQH